MIVLQSVLVLALIKMVVISYYVMKFRDWFPIKEKSPYLTIFQCQLIFFYEVNFPVYTICSYYINIVKSYLIFKRLVDIGLLLIIQAINIKIVRLAYAYQQFSYKKLHFFFSNEFY